MDELTQLRAMRNEIGEPSLDALSPAFERLERRMTRAAGRKKRHRRVVAAIAAAAIAVVAVGQGTVAVQASELSSVLNAAADNTIEVVNPVVGQGQYLKITTRAYVPVITDHDGLPEPLRYMRLNTIEKYIPGDQNADWVVVETLGKPEAFSSPEAEAQVKDWQPKPPEIIRAKNGMLYGKNTRVFDYAAMPLEPQELLDYFDAQYNGGSASRDEDNWGRMVDVLRQGDVPSDVRAAVYRAIALLSNVTVGDRKANLDGRVGIAIGRDELLRGERQEIIIDPDTGLLIGERHIVSLPVFGGGFAVGDVMSSSSVTTEVVDSAP